jgi:hypothetical protein
MLAGELYIADDPELTREHLQAMVLMKRFNGSSAADPDLPFQFRLEPVFDLEEAVAAQAEGIAWRDSNAPS